VTVDQLELKIMKSLGIEAALITGQVYPRLYDFIVLNSFK